MPAEPRTPQEPENPEDPYRNDPQNQGSAKPNSQSHDSVAPNTNDDDQPAYGVRLSDEELAAWRAEREAELQGQEPTQHHGSAAQAPHNQQQYGSFTPHQYGSEYGQQYPQGVPPASGPTHHYNQQYAGQNQSGQFQAHPQHPEVGPGVTMEPPKHIKLARNLIYAAGAVFVIINIVVSLLPNLGMSAQELALIEDQFQDVPGGESFDVEAMLSGPVRIMSIIFTLLFGAVYWVIGRGIFSGSRVARIFGTILAVGSLTNAFGIGIVYVALGVAGIALSYTNQSNEYFRYKAWERFNQHMSMMMPPPNHPQDPNDPPRPGA